MRAAEKAAVLAESLPYIRRFWGKVVVIKYGGSALEEGQALALFAQDVALMRSVGLRPVVVHGGGPQIGQLMARLGKVAEFRDGLRVTDAETLDIARMVLVGKINRDFVSAINVHGPLAVGLSGQDAGLITASARAPELGFVGDVAAVNPSIVERLLVEEIVPVIATIASGPDGHAYNVNADTAAAALAVAVRADKLVLLTDVAGIYREIDGGRELLSELSPEEARLLVSGGVVSRGMIPKVTAALAAVEGGVPSAHIVGAATPHSVLLELFTRSGIGTMIHPVAPEPIALASPE